MSEKTFLRASTVLSLGGVLFAGYLSGIKLFTGTCAFNEPCPYFLGYPSCWYGFGLFLALFLLSLAALLGKVSALQATKWIAGVSLAGIIFAGWFVVQEVYGWMTVGRVLGYGLGLPTCVYGLIFYAIIFGMSVGRTRTPRVA